MVNVVFKRAAELLSAVRFNDNLYKDGMTAEKVIDFIISKIENEGSSTNSRFRVKLEAMKLVSRYTEESEGFYANIIRTLKSKDEWTSIKSSAEDIIKDVTAAQFQKSGEGVMVQDFKLKKKDLEMSTAEIFASLFFRDSKKYRDGDKRYYKFLKSEELAEYATYGLSFDKDDDSTTPYTPF